MPYAKELAAAREAARLAGEEIMALYATFDAVKEPPATISTEADRRSQDVILEHLHAAFPDDAFCAEEATPTLAALRRQGERLWIIDPIDGTRGFAKKIGEFSVMIGLVEQGHVAVGVVLEPARGRCTYAVRGGSCWRQDGTESPQACQVSTVDQVNRSTLVQSRSGKDVLSASAFNAARFLSTYSAGVKMAMVARGEADVYTSTYGGYNSWDVAAGEILVHEAGGKTTDARGQTIVYPDGGVCKINGVVTSNGRLHEAALRAIVG